MRGGVHVDFAVPGVVGEAVEIRNRLVGFAADGQAPRVVGIASDHDSIVVNHLADAA